MSDNDETERDIPRWKLLQGKANFRSWKRNLQIDAQAAGVWDFFTGYERLIPAPKPADYGFEAGNAPARDTDPVVTFDYEVTREVPDPALHAVQAPGDAPVTPVKKIKETKSVNKRKSTLDPDELRAYKDIERKESRKSRQTLSPDEMSSLLQRSNDLKEREDGFQGMDFAGRLALYRFNLDEHDKSRKREQKALSMLVRRVMENIRPSLQAYKDPFTAIVWLEQQYAQLDAVELELAENRFEEIHFSRSRSAQDYLNELQSTRQDINDLGGTCTERAMISKLIRGLRDAPSYKGFIDEYRLFSQMAPQLLTYDNLTSRLLTWENDLGNARTARQRSDRTDRPSGTSKAARSSNSANNKAASDKPNVTCHECGIKGHYARDCRKRTNPSSSSATTVRTTKTVSASKKPFPSKKVVSMAAADAESVVKQLDEHALMSEHGRRQILGTSTSAPILPSHANFSPSLGDSLAGGQTGRMFSQPVSLLRSSDSSCIVPACCSIQSTDDDITPDTWILDSGSNLHIVNDRKWFSTYVELTQDVGTADGSGNLHVEGGGAVSLPLDASGDVTDLVLQTVVYAPTSRCNILSLSLLSKRAGLKGQWGKDGIDIVDKDGHKVGQAPEINGLFPLSLAKAEPPLVPECNPVVMPEGVRPPYIVAAVDYTDPVWLIHRRMGHLGLDNLRHLLKASTGLNLTEAQIKAKLGALCPVCEITRATVGISREPATRRYTKVGDLVHVDAWGPHNTPSYDGTRYFLLVTDDACRYVWVRRMKDRAQLPQLLRRMIKQIEKVHKVHVRRVRMDLEFARNGLIKAWCEKHSIEVQSTAPYQHNQNGVAERGHRTERDRAAAMLQEPSIAKRLSSHFSAKREQILRAVDIPDSLWPEAFLHAVWLKNRSPTRAHKSRKTPWEALTGVKPNLARERTWGSNAYVTIPHEVRKGPKLSTPRGWSGIFVGFDNESIYRVWDMEKQMVRTSANVRVDDKFFEGLQDDEELADEEHQNGEAQEEEVNANQEARVNDRRHSNSDTAAAEPESDSGDNPSSDEESQSDTPESRKDSDSSDLESSSDSDNDSDSPDSSHLPATSPQQTPTVPTHEPESRQPVHREETPITHPPQGEDEPALGDILEDVNDVAEDVFGSLDNEPEDEQPSTSRFQRFAYTGLTTMGKEWNEAQLFRLKQGLDNGKTVPAIKKEFPDTFHDRTTSAMRNMVQKLKAGKAVTAGAGSPRKVRNTEAATPHLTTPTPINPTKSDVVPYREGVKGIKPNSSKCAKCFTRRRECIGGRPCQPCTDIGLECTEQDSMTANLIPDENRGVTDQARNVQVGVKCHSCQVARLRCDGAKPKCSSCVKGKLQCKPYDPEDKYMTHAIEATRNGDDDRRCHTCARLQRPCDGTYPFETPCTRCVNQKLICEPKGAAKHGVKRENKCARCIKYERKCDGQRPCNTCSALKNGPWKCVDRDQEIPKTRPSSPCIRCRTARPNTCNGESPCQHCTKAKKTCTRWLNDDGTHRVEYISNEYVDERTLNITEDDCCAYCAEQELEGSIVHSDKNFPCNICIEKAQEYAPGVRGCLRKCIRARADGGTEIYEIVPAAPKSTSNNRHDDMDDRDEPPRPKRSSRPRHKIPNTRLDDPRFQQWESSDNPQTTEKYPGPSPHDPNLLTVERSDRGEESASAQIPSLTRSTDSRCRQWECDKEPTHKDRHFVVNAGADASEHFSGKDKGKRIAAAARCLVTAVDLSKDPEPRTRREALRRPDGPQWDGAMDDEYQSLLDNNTWTVVYRPTGRRVLTGRWVFRRKLDATGSVARHKARFVVRGFEQVFGLDFDETFASVVKPPSYKLFFAIAAYMRWHCHQMDVKTAFLNGDVDEDIYVEPPDGYPEAEGRVLKLNRSLYGLKQAPRQWYQKLRDFLLANGWQVSQYDTSVFFDGRGLFMTVYVDDINLFGSDIHAINRTKELMKSRFQMSDLGQCAYYLGMHVITDNNGSIKLSQQSFVEQLLNRFSLRDIRPVSTPMDTARKLEANNSSTANPEFRRLYQSMVGSLNYLMTVARPDIAFAVGAVSRYASNPSQRHMDAVRRIYAYLKRFPDIGPSYQSAPDNAQACELVGYVDSDWAGCHDTRRSTTGWTFTLGGTPIAWASKRQKSVAMSTCEAEYIAAAEAAKEAIWLRNLLSELNIPQISLGPTTLMIDNNAAMKLTKNPEFHARTKHIELRHHFLREQVLEGNINVVRVDTKDNLADIFTKPLARAAFESFTTRLHLVDPQDQRLMQIAPAEEDLEEFEDSS